MTIEWDKDTDVYKLPEADTFEHIRYSSLNLATLYAMPDRHHIQEDVTCIWICRVSRECWLMLTDGTDEEVSAHLDPNEILLFILEQAKLTLEDK